MPEHILYVSPQDAGAIGRALSTLPRDGAPAKLVLAPGVYHEKVVIARENTELCAQVPGKSIITWGDGAKARMDDGQRRGTFRTATLRTDAAGITLSGLTICNSAAPREEAGQAIALYADSDGLLVRDCTLRSFQDTLFTAPLPPKEIETNGFIGPKQFAPRIPQRQRYERCTIFGDIDFIFGGACAWFEACTLVSVDGRRDKRAPYVGYVTAASTPKGQAYGYVFSGCHFTSEGCPPGSVYIGRPWREWANVCLLHCTLDEHIAVAGFDDWGKPLAHETARFEEYASIGPGASPMRAPFVRMLTAEEAATLTPDRLWDSLSPENPTT